MSESVSPYHEKLLHWIWENRGFNFRNLETIDGQKVRIHDTGRINKSDGPDFLSAEITIDNLRWFGNVELHWSLSDWRAHDHHADPNYDNVILHVVFNATENHSHRSDETEIPTLCLAPHLSQPLQSFLEQYQSKPELPCAGQLSFISDEAFAQQLQKAHKEYFEQKVDDLLAFYDASLPPSKAWVKMLTLGLFDGLGISHNRHHMRKLCNLLYQNDIDTLSKNAVRIRALKLSGINTDHNDTARESINWNHKGCRPGNHPRLRIQQSAELLWHIHQRPFEQWLRDNPREVWKKLLNDIRTKPGIGQERASILFGTVFLPAMYFLGNLFFREPLKNHCWSLWQKHEAQIPSSLLKLFENTGIPSSLYKKKLGSIYQLRSYCRPRNCQDCKVFKSVISS
ncbi:hypothetical protein CK503_13850 [Aliifodinibius salipaludis]|uniref:DUF2851 domain-containing protein n=1 Tax=Fodinibius salipaludis TaxID=2032627 RepID=A0A2A2G820_9BACT|nr:DUF2851 family protein [Aliifodinibius salipaludis]PAU93002.1 hypothetical protein CK503_13850 [Aliifodinibius salipaludis]